MILFLLLLVFIPFVWVVFIGAPYVPAHTDAVEKAVKEVELSKKGRVLDLGCGDGKFLLAAAKKGYKCTGYEFNIFVSFIARFRLRKFPMANVRSENLWKVSFPDDTEVVYIFLLEKFMKRLDEKMQSEAKRLKKDLTLISYVFKIPGKKPIKEVGGVRVYEYPVS
jgi:SAM-dependent methyltransferase